jgi:outer membrane protein OmpA-like peptidoglycan-associated protein
MKPGSSRCAPARRLLAAAGVTVCAASTGIGPASAQSWDALPDEPASRASIVEPGLRLGFGPAVTGTPNDPEAGPTLISGSAFTGSTFRFGGVLGLRIANPLRVRIEAGVGFGTISGFEETDLYRRELKFRLTTIDVPVALEAGVNAGPVRFTVHGGAGLRAGVGVAGQDTRSGESPDEPVIDVRTGLAFGALVGGGLSFDVGPVQIPLEVRYWRSINYPGNTADRYETPDSETDRGRYWIDAAWTLVVSTGVDFPLTRRERIVSEPIVQPVYVPPPPPPTPPPMPDHDSDGVPDALDACPIEPVDPLLGMTTAGCPEGGGIVTLSCELISLSMPIEFVTGSAELDPMSFPVLYLIADTMNIAQNVRIVSIEGHTDDRGNDDANWVLSEDRAYAVLDFLVSAGVDPSRLEAVGYGETMPVGENETPEGRAMNRRVELRIISNDTCGF